MGECCKTGFKWGGTPTGTESTVAGNKTYVAGNDKDTAILLIHDIFGWTFSNNRLLADHLASEVGATVYLPDFFGGDVVPEETLTNPEKRGQFDVMAFIGKNSKEIRGPEMVSIAKELKSKYKKVGAVGYCYGGWAVFQLGAKGKGLVDAISTAHPSILTKEEIDAVGVPVQILAPENDPMFTPELKEYANKTIPTLGVPYAYEYFPGVAHGFAVRCDENDAHQKAALVRAKNAAAGWFSRHLKVEA